VVLLILSLLAVIAGWGWIVYLAFKQSSGWGVLVLLGSIALYVVTFAISDSYQLNTPVYIYLLVFINAIPCIYFILKSEQSIVPLATFIVAYILLAYSSQQVNTAMLNEQAANNYKSTEQAQKLTEQQRHAVASQRLQEKLAAREQKTKALKQKAKPTYTYYKIGFYDTPKYIGYEIKVFGLNGTEHIGKLKGISRNADLIISKQYKHGTGEIRINQVDIKNIHIKQLAQK